MDTHSLSRMSWDLSLVRLTRRTGAWGGVVLSATLLALAGTPLPLAPQGTFAAEFQVANRYLFAGAPVATEGVTTAGATWESPGGGFSLYGFAVLDHEFGEVTEADLAADYYLQVTELVGFYGGVGFFNFQEVNGWEPSYEVYGGVVLEVPLTPSLYVARDLELSKGTHATLEVSHTLVFVEGGPFLDLVASVDYNDRYYSSISGWSYADFEASLGLPLGPATFTPFVLIQRAIDETFTHEELYGLSVRLSRR